MEHEFSHTPIKVRYTNLKTGEWNKSYVFVGNVPEQVQRELQKIQKLYSAARQSLKSAVLKKFYGSNWQYRLGLIHKKSGAADVLGGVDAEEEIPDIDDLIDAQADVLITDDDLNQIDQIEQEEPTSSVDNLLQVTEKSEKIQQTGGVEFIFNQSVYPVDNIMDLKNKIYIQTGIPIYRQHLWYKYNDRSYAAQYSLSIFRNSKHIDIEQLIAHYRGKKVLDTIENIPVDTGMYRNKDFITVQAYDTFALLYNNYRKHGTTEYFLVDLNDLCDSNAIYSKLKTDKYQLELLYYGFILLYFPMITFSIFTDYLKNENSLHEIYPELKPDKSYLRKRYEMDSKITDESYAAQNDIKQISARLFSSITGTVVSIQNYTQDIDVLLVLRNIFDLLQLTPTITYCKANLIHDGKNVILKKAYFNEPDPRDTIPINSLMIKIKTNVDTTEHMKLIIFKNGNYIIRTNWREENHMTFKKITDVVARKVNPLIQMINKMGARVKHYAIQLADITPKNIQFTETSFVFYYDDDVTDARFQVFRQALADLQRAGIIDAKENVVMGHEFFFRRGMYKFDASRIEKAISVENYYEYLSNSVVRQKWSTIFERTRLFQVLNVSSKLKISISGIRNDIENHFFYLYLIGLINIYRASAAKIKSDIRDVTLAKSKRNLKNLKLQDPILYDFKKIYRSNVVYSKICQKPYQPLILSDKEYASLSKERKSRVVRYWNFTKDKPALYSCPNPKFPFIKFIVKQHPKDYCIPCCKKIAMNENVNQKKQEIHNACLTEHRYTGKKVLLTKGSHYIATYGKNIEVGRISRLPEYTLEPLFFDTYSPGGGIDQECITADGYYLFGVDQHTESIQHVGYVFCLIHALKMSLDEFLADCTARIKKDHNKFRTLMDGTVGMYFTDYRDLADRLYMVGETTLIESPYDRVPWNNLFISIAYYYYGVNSIIFVDQSREQINMHLPKGLKTPEEMFPPTHQNLIVLQRKSTYYPIYLLNTEIFKRTGIIESRLFINESGLMSTIQAVVRRHFDGEVGEVIKQHITLSVVKDFVRATSTAVITGYYVNYANLCYAVIVKFQNAHCYFPIRASHYSLDEKIDLIFKPYSERDAASIDIQLRLFAAYNKWVEHESKKAKLDSIHVYPLVTVEKWLALHGKDTVIGFCTNNTNYYCKRISVKTATHYDKKPIQYLLYDPAHINQIIHSIKSGGRRIGLTKELYRTTQLNAYQYHLYEIVMLQFINIFNKQHNVSLRKKLLHLIARTNFDKSMDEIRQFLIALDDQEDAARIKNAIGRYLLTHRSKKQLVSDITNTYYSFDKIALEKMKTLPYKSVLAELHKLAKQFVKIGKISRTSFEFPNVVTACEKSSDNPDYCSGNKFIIGKKELDEILQVVAYDIINPSKWKWLFHSAFVARTVNFFVFTRRPAETIYVEFVK